MAGTAADLVQNTPKQIRTPSTKAIDSNRPREPSCSRKLARQRGWSHVGMDWDWNSGLATGRRTLAVAEISYFIGLE